MNSTLRFNDALLIADHAFHPFQCIAWTPQPGSGELSLSIVDRAHSRLLGRTQLKASAYSDPVQLASVLQKSRDELSQQGYALDPWSMPE